MSKYSIIVPVYNTAKYLEKCIESLRNQTYTDFEVILVDDCSTDDSYEICKSISELDSRFTVIRQEKNQGQSAARNLGLNNICGEYVLFVDSDDYVETSYLEIIDSEKQDFDLLTWGNFMLNISAEGEKIITDSPMNMDIFSNMATNKKWAELFKTFFASPWNKLYKTQIIRDNNISFDITLGCYEDYMFNIDYCKNVNSFKSIKTPLYYYRIIESQNPILKRKWRTLFDVSDKVFNNTKDFYQKKTGSKLSDVFLYPYRAYWVELEYAYMKGTLDDAINRVMQSKNIRECVGRVRKHGKFILALYLALVVRSRAIVKRLVAYYIRGDLDIK